MMKRNLFKLLGLLAIVCSVCCTMSCNDLVQDIEQVVVKMPIEKIVFSPDENVVKGITEQSYYQEEINFDLDSLLDINHSNILHNARIDDLIIGINYPIGQDLTFLNSVYVTLALNEDFVDEVIVAEVRTIGSSACSLEMMIYDNSLVSYLSEERFYIRIYCDTKDYQELEENTTLFLEGDLVMILE